MHPRVFTVTAGDVFEFANTRQTPLSDSQETAAAMMKVFGLMHYDVIALGEKDLSYGRDFLDQQAKANGLTLVCANAVDATSGEPLFAPYVVVEREGVKVAFIGVVSPERHIVAQVETTLNDHKIRIEDPTEHVRKHLDVMRKESDLVVLLSHTGIETSEFLAEDLDVDVVLVGHYPAVGGVPKEIAGTLVAMAGAKSDRFGTLALDLDENGKIVRSQGDAVRLLQKGPQNDEIQLISEEWDRKDKEKKRERAVAAQRDREAMASESAVEEVHHRNGVMGAESCKSCHTPVYERWAETPHATAFATLAEADAWDDPECIGCHATGIHDKSYVLDVNIAPEVWNVQCEECHGSGLQHARDGSYQTQGEATCRKCHDPDNSPEFDYALYSSYGVH